jgi:GNAT superfamily N-acetyltransferase
MCAIVELPPSEAADIALKHRLYVSGWCFSSWFKTYKKEPEKARSRVRTLLAYEDDTPAGVLVHNKEHNCISVFVRKSMRRRGIGTKLVAQAQPSSGWVHTYGAKHTHVFWDVVRAS